MSPEQNPEQNPEADAARQPHASHPSPTTPPDGPIPTPYEDLLRLVLASGTPKGDRTGTGTRSVFGHQLRYDLSAGFPLVTTKRVFLRGLTEELLWFLRGEHNARTLQDEDVHIWDEWADPETGDLGPVYGAQWRTWRAADGRVIDQISQLIDTLRTDPDSRRMLVSAWNVGELDRMALMPCHAFFQCYAADGRLSLQVYQRSADLFLGVPFNIASYALLAHMIAQQADLEAGELVWTGGDCHIYDNHVDQVREQLAREPYPYPTLHLRKAPAIDRYTWEDVRVEGYRHHPTIKAPVAV